MATAEVVPLLERLGKGDVDGEDAVVFGTYHRRFAKNGRNFDTPEAVHIRVVDGRIVRWHLYGDTGLVEDAWLDR
jgi:uncharacterized protein